MARKNERWSDVEEAARWFHVSPDELRARVAHVRGERLLRESQRRVDRMLGEQCALGKTLDDLREHIRLSKAIDDEWKKQDRLTARLYPKARAVGSER